MRESIVTPETATAEPFTKNGSGRTSAHDRLEVFIGRWINEGHTVEDGGRADLRVLTSDVYEWMPGRFYVLHTAYGRVGDLGVGGTEILGYDVRVGAYLSLFFDSSGGIQQSSLTADGDTWTWEGRTTGCTAVFTDAGNVQAAHHVRLNPAGQWVPSMEVVLRKIA